MLKSTLVNHRGICMFKFHTGRPPQHEASGDHAYAYVYSEHGVCARGAEHRKFQLSHKYATAGIIKVNTLV